MSLTITPCVVASVKVSISGSSPPALNNQNYIISPTAGFSIQLLAVPSCSLTVSDWQITSTPVSGTHPEIVNVNVATGLFTIAAN